MKKLTLALVYSALAACGLPPLPPLEVRITERPNPHITSGYVAAISLSGRVCRIALQGQGDPEAREQAIRDGIEWCEQNRR